MTDAWIPQTPSPTHPARLVATLSLVGLVSGLALAGTYLVTRPHIERHRARALEEAVLTVVPGATRFTRLAPDAPVYAAADETGRHRGFAIVAEGPGFADTIRLIYGFDPDHRKVIGMRVLESRETPGLGDKIVTNEAFVSSFDALAIDPHIVDVKKGGSAHANEVDCITGATISSRAVIAIVQNSLTAWVAKLPRGQTPALERRP